MSEQRWSIAELQDELARFEKELKAKGFQENTVRTYVDRSQLFLRWLVGAYEPQGPRR